MQRKKAHSTTSIRDRGGVAAQRAKVGIAIAMNYLQQFWSPDNSAPPVSEQELRASELAMGVTFPDSLVTLWRMHNGGPGGLTFLRLGTPNDANSIRTLSELGRRGDYIDSEALESIQEAIGDPSLLLTLAFDGAYCWVLNFNSAGPRGMPSVWMLDLGGNFIFEDCKQVANTFNEFAQHIRGC